MHIIDPLQYFAWNRDDTYIVINDVWLSILTTRASIKGYCRAITT